MAAPAPAITGLAMLEAALEAEKQKPTPASTGCPAIDDSALDGGLRYGEITSIAGSSGMGKTLITLQVTASHLLAHETGEVALIDTTGSFSPLRLQDVIAWRLSCLSGQARYQQSGFIYERTPANQVDESINVLNEEAAHIMDRVKVMRVFDFAGSVEAIDEVGHLWETSGKNTEGQTLREYSTPDNEVPSSQDIDNEDISSDDVELGRTSRETGIGVIVIDNFANLVNTMMAKSQFQGQGLLMAFMRSLHHLTTRHHICTLLVNSAVGLNPSNNPNYQRGPEENASIFASTPGKPALGKVFAHLIDTSLFLSSIPRTKEDAELAYGGSGCGDAKWKSVGILEVLKDRYGVREGRWAAFDILNGVELRA